MTMLSVLRRSIFPLVLAGLVAFLISPLVVLVATSFTETKFLTFPPQGFTTEWYSKVFSDVSWGKAALNSLWIACLSSLIGTVVGVPAAIILARKGIKATNLVTLLIMAPITVPSIMYVLGLMLGFGQLRVAPPSWAIALALSVLTIPYIVRTMMASLSQLDPALEEAAMSLGASRLRAWIGVVLPNVAAAYLSGLMLAFILAFDELIVPLFLAGPTFPTLPVRIYRSVAYDVSPELAAVSTILILITVILATFAVRDPSITKSVSN